jgi:short-chain Z-isoprenyl diphosphate synthase
VPARDLLYAMYERRLRRQLVGRPVPRHVGVMCDGNRRWARAAGAGDVSFGHQAGADKIEDVLRWSADAGVEVVTLWLLSTDNLSRPESELQPLLRIIEELVDGLAADRAGWRIKLVG